MQKPHPHHPEVPDLQVEVSVSPDPVRVGSPLTLTIVVRNAGLVTANGAVIEQKMPPDLMLVCATSTRGSCTVVGDLITCEVGAMPPGTAVMVTAVVSPLRVGALGDRDVAAAVFEPEAD